jgi:hypothetical protein
MVCLQYAICDMDGPPCPEDISVSLALYEFRDKTINGGRIADWMCLVKRYTGRNLRYMLNRAD